MEKEQVQSNLEIWRKAEGRGDVLKELA